MAVDHSLSTNGLPDEAGSPKPRSELHDCWATPLPWLVSYAPYLVAYVSVFQGSASKKLWSITMFITQRMVSGPAPFVVWPVNDDWSPMTPFESIALWKNIRPAVTAAFQNAAFVVSKQAQACCYRCRCQRCRR